MEFGTVLVLVVLLVLPIAAVMFAGAFGLLEQLGEGGLSTLDRVPAPPVPPPQTRASTLEREEEIRQLVQARHDRQAARGEEPVDVEAEVTRLVDLSDDPPVTQRHDEALRDEIRQLVIARNERRAARGEQPLDVETEIERQLEDFDWPASPDS
jgi:hypothetical protein